MCCLLFVVYCLLGVVVMVRLFMSSSLPAYLVVVARFVPCVVCCVLFVGCCLSFTVWFCSLV